MEVPQKRPQKKSKEKQKKPKDAVISALCTLLSYGADPAIASAIVTDKVLQDVLTKFPRNSQRVTRSHINTPSVSKDRSERRESNRSISRRLRSRSRTMPRHRARTHAHQFGALFNQSHRPRKRSRSSPSPKCRPSLRRNKEEPVVLD